MEDLKNIIRELKGYKQTLFLNASDDMILDCATRIFNSQNIEHSKKLEISEKPTLQPTTKQIKILKENKKYRDGLTRAEASGIIDELAKSWKKKK